MCNVSSSFRGFHSTWESVDEVISQQRWNMKRKHGENFQKRIEMFGCASTTKFINLRERDEMRSNDEVEEGKEEEEGEAMGL